MRLFITGYSGQLGYDVAREAERRGYEFLGVGSKDLDITDSSAVDRAISDYAPDAVVHCAAYTKVDLAEDNEELCRKVNVDGTRAVAQSCARLGCPMIYLSTDYVFDGQGTSPWEPDCKDFAPLNVYGKSKLDGEMEVTKALSKYFIVRIAWVFGKNGNNFIKTMLKVAKNHSQIRVVSDQIGTPTYTADLARLLVDMLETDRYGFYHATNEGGYISWYEFSREIFRQRGVDIEVIPVTSEEYGLSKAARPKNSRLDKRKLVQYGFTPLPDWKDALSRYLEEIGDEI